MLFSILPRNDEASAKSVFPSAADHQEADTGSMMLQKVMGLLFEGDSDDTGNITQDDDGAWEDSIARDDLIQQVQTVLQQTTSSTGDGTTTGTTNTTKQFSPSELKDLDDCFNTCDQKALREEHQAEFKVTEEFILEEQIAHRDRQKTARRLEGSEEKRLAAEVAQLKGLRLKSRQANSEDDLRWKISNAERSYTSRKMVYAKASQVAASELRLQFSRVRTFLEELHQSRQATLYRQHRRTLNFQTLRHTLQETDPRVVSLDQQITLRLFRKKKADLNEFHMQRTLEEAMFLESMMDALDRVQRAKETAARDIFDLHVRNLKTVRNNSQRRQEDVELLVASGTLEMAKLVVQYTDEDDNDQVEELRVNQKVEAIERSKEFRFENDKKQGSSAKYVSTTKLYDTILWSVASNDLGFTSSGSSLYSSDYGSECLEEHEEGSSADLEEKEEDDNESTHNHEKCLTPVGTMHARQLARDLREREKAMLKKHDMEIREEKRLHQKEYKELKAKHQAIIDGIVESSITEREALRDAIDQRLEALALHQEQTTEQLQKTDWKLMKEALLAEDRRVEEAESNSFRKAQELISAQVFHEVRNALSAVIAMSEMTDTLKLDKMLKPEELLGSVDGMLDQVGDVVNYALKMLNEILDVSKINSGAFVAKKESFDLQDVVARATRMQQAKACSIKMAFQPFDQPCIAYSDAGIVERVVATMISNAVKFTASGAVQPFVWPLESIQTQPAPTTRRSRLSISAGSDSETHSTASMSSSCYSEESCGGSVSDNNAGRETMGNRRTKLYAVGVADTGCGLTEDKLKAAKEMISTTSGASSHGAQNTGFGLYHAHLQAKALGSHLTLSSLDECKDLLNGDMLRAVEQRVTSGSNHQRPGEGTVLFLTVPVYEDGEVAEKELKKNAAIVQTAKASASTCSAFCFRPLPAPGSSCFRILVADDILMLRKGVVHTLGQLWSQRFPDCPVSISTACTAEDMLRAVDEEAFDLIICDHHFNPLDSSLATTEDALTTHRRPYLLFDGRNSYSPEATRRRMRTFFETERFTSGKKDGSLLGFDALVQLAELESSLRFPRPILMLLSGHKVEPRQGIIVTQKPLKSKEFLATLERHALVAGCCHQSKNGGNWVLVNQRGSQIYARETSHDRPQMSACLVAETNTAA